MVLACGRKASLIPRSELVPQPVTDLRVMGKEDRAILSWNAPDSDIRGGPVRDLSLFTILRDSLPFDRLPCKECPPRFTDIYEMSAPEDKGVFLPGAAYGFSDTPLTYGVRYQYQVVVSRAQGGTSRRSPAAVLYWDVPPAPPGGLKGLAGDRHILLSWTRPEITVDGTPMTDVAGYAVYRKEGGGTYPLLSVSHQPVTDTTYTDGGLENHRQYYYTVRALRRVYDSLVEGPPSNEILLVPYRMDVPPCPEGVMAACTSGGIELTWKKSDDPEVAGYHIYRRKEGESRLTRITGRPIPEPHFTDRGARKGKTYFYAVKSVEGPPLERESPPSGEVRAACR